MKEEFLEWLNRNKLCKSEDKILLTVSGGIDSMVMLHLFRECGFKIGVAHVNFQLRGEESTGDEEFVKSACDDHSVPFYAKKFDTTGFAAKNSLSIQMAARELRYTWFNELAKEYNYDCIATAHHLNDSLETVLINFVRGSGMEGLDGIQLKNGKVIRPMLFATQEDILRYANENKISWREDSSNASDDYQRNFIRHKVIPLLKEMNPSLEHTFQDVQDKIAGANELKVSGIGYWMEDFALQKHGQTLLDKKGFQGFHNVDGILWNLIKHFGFNLDQCRQVIKSLHGQSGKKFYSHDHELVIDREHLIISKLEDQLDEIQINKGVNEVRLVNFILKFSEVLKADFSEDSSVCFLDADKIQFPLLWRKWKAGDHFHPLGMTHQKKVSDFLIDRKVSVTDKETVTVLESGAEIVWVVGYRIDDRFKISNSTKRIIRLELAFNK